MSLIKGLRNIADRHYEWATTGSKGRIPTGFPFFDGATGGGCARGEVLMLLARSGVGKTWFALNLVNNSPTVPTLFVSLEMQDRFLLQRLAAMHMNTTTQLIEQEVRTVGASQAMEETLDHFPHLEIVDKPELSLKNMSQAIKEYEEVHQVKPELVVADYLELIKAGLSMSSLEAVDNVSRAVKNWSRAEDVSFTVLHQTNMNTQARISERGELDNGHLPLTRMAARFGGDVAADYTVGMFKPSLDPRMTEVARSLRENELWLQLLKNRGGHQLYEGGVQHHVDIRNWKITPWVR